MFPSAMGLRYSLEPCQWLPAPLDGGVPYGEAKKPSAMGLRYSFTSPV
jgi:hypothetical protein